MTSLSERRFILAGLVAAALAVPSSSLAEGKVVAVRTGEAPVISEIVSGLRASLAGEAVEDVLLTDAKSEATLAKRLDGATGILSIGVRAAAAVAKLKPAAPTIAVVPPAQADPATLGTSMRLQAPADGLLAAVAWMDGRFRKVGVILESSAIERRRILEVEAEKRGIRLTAVTTKDAREILNAVGEMVGKNDLVIVDVSEGIQASDVQFMLRAAQDAQVPLLGSSEGFVKAGAPGAITIDPRNVGSEAGRLLQEKASGMFDPRRFRVIVNLVAMDRLGVTVPRDRGVADGNILVVDTDIDALGRVAQPVKVTSPLVAKKGRLVFPAIARINQIRAAEVVLEVVVKADGSLGETKVLKGDDMFARAAIDSIKSWQFQPGTRDGAPVDAPLRLNLKFQQ